MTMVEVRKCDRCGKLIDPGGPYGFVLRQECDSSYTEFDICAECRPAFYEFLDELKQAQRKMLTVEDFARLGPAWPEYLGLGKGVLLARVHPNCNRPKGDEDVLARALVYMSNNGELRRMTIRRSNIRANADGFLRDYAKAYRECLNKILELPVLDLTNSTPALDEDARICPDCETDSSAAALDIGGWCWGCEMDRADQENTKAGVSQ